MIDIKITQRGDGVLTLKGLPSKLTRAMKSAQRDVMKHLRAEIVRRTTAKYYITAARLRSAMQVFPTSIKVSGARQLIHHYKLSPTKRGKRPRPLMGAVKKGGLKPLGGNAFLFPTSGGKAIAMYRLTRQRYPIDAIVGPAVPQLVGNPEIVEGLEGEAESTFNKRLEYWAMKAIGAVK